MDQSKIDATAVVLRRLANYPKDHGTGALIEDTVPDCSGRRTSCSRATSSNAIDGKPVGGYRATFVASSTTREGQALSFQLDVDGQAERATFARKPCGPDEELLVGFRSIDAFPFPVSMTSGDIGGPRPD